LKAREKAREEANEKPKKKMHFSKEVMEKAAREPIR
jgi:hypothetical protein